MATKVIFQVLFFSSLLIFSNGAFANWKQSSIADKETINNLCGGEEKYNVSDGDFAIASVYKNRSTKFIVCHSKSEKPEDLTLEYILKYDQGAKPIALHMDSEMMTWGADVVTKGEVLKASLYWPSDKKFHRKIREFRVDCAGKCKFKEDCSIEHLKSDLDFDQLVKKIDERTKTNKMRAHFVVDGNQNDSNLADQLFAEALAGNKKAVTILSKLRTGIEGNAAASEIIGTYELYLNDLKSKGCHWGK